MANYGTTPTVDLPELGESGWGTTSRTAFQTIVDFLGIFANSDGTLKSSTSATPWQTVTSSVTYVGATSFSVADTYESYFVPGRKVWVNQATDVVGKVFSATTVASVTTVVLYDIVLYSDNATASTVTDPITSVSVSMVTPQSTPLMQGRRLNINGDGVVMQGSAYSLSGAAASTYGYGPDMWEAAWSGSACSAGSFTNTTSASNGRTGNAVRFSGVTLTGTGILYGRTKIESKDAKQLKNTAATFSSNVYHDVGSAINVTASIYKANAADNFSATTLIESGTAVSVSSATATEVTVSTSDMGDCSNGVMILLTIECGAITTKNVYVTEAQIEEGSVATPFEWRGYSEELAKCRRYYIDYDSGSGWIDLFCGDVTSGGGYFKNVQFPVEMLTAPTVTLADGSAQSLFPSSGVSAANISAKSFRTSLTANSTGTAGYYTFRWTADARI